MVRDMFTSDNELIRDRICDFRKNLKVTQQEMAIYLNMKRGSYQSRESQGNFNWEEIEQIADFFGASPFFIKYGAEEEDLKIIAKIVKTSDSAFHQPSGTVFDDIDKINEMNQVYVDFLNLGKSDQMRIIRHINSNNY